MIIEKFDFLEVCLSGKFCVNFHSVALKGKSYTIRLCRNLNFLHEHLIKSVLTSLTSKSKCLLPYCCSRIKRMADKHLSDKYPNHSVLHNTARQKKNSQPHCKACIVLPWRDWLTLLGKHYPAGKHSLHICLDNFLFYAIQ